MTGSEAYHDYRKLLENREVDAVWIATPEHWHARQAIEALEAGKHIYLEKPVGTDVRGCKKVLELGKKIEGKQSANVGFQIRFSPEYRELSRRIHEGAIQFRTTVGV